MSYRVIYKGTVVECDMPLEVEELVKRLPPGNVPETHSLATEASAPLISHQPHSGRSERTKELRKFMAENPEWTVREVAEKFEMTVGAVYQHRLAMKRDKDSNNSTSVTNAHST